MKETTIKAINKHTGVIGTFIPRQGKWERVDKGKDNGKDFWENSQFNKHWDISTDNLNEKANEVLRK